LLMFLLFSCGSRRPCAPVFGGFGGPANTNLTYTSDFWRRRFLSYFNGTLGMGHGVGLMKLMR
ncbi:hypothetical protein HAX54_016857, partial [Datura stramonium]|nr:hypothetical protein [Datura stramonium]